MAKRVMYPRSTFRVIFRARRQCIGKFPISVLMSRQELSASRTKLPVTCRLNYLPELLYTFEQVSHQTRYATDNITRDKTYKCDLQVAHSFQCCMKWSSYGNWF